MKIAQQCKVDELTEVISHLKNDIKKVVDKYDNKDPQVELIVNEDYIVFQMFLEHCVELRISISPLMNIPLN